jgi:hypothetical protein
MSILETFYILFESNAEDVQKGTDEAFKATDKLEEKIKATDKAAVSAGSAFQSMMAGAAGAIASALSLGAIVNGVLSAATYADTVGKFSETLGLNVEDIDAWGNAVKFSGGSAEGFRSSVQNLSKGLTDFAVKGNSEIAPFFDKLGIKMVDAEGKVRDVMDILPDLADSFEGLTKQESAALGSKLGLDQGTILLLQQGKREVDAQIKAQKELGVITQKQAEVSAKYNDAIDATAIVFRSLFAVIGESVLPAFTRILEAIQTGGKFMRAHKDFFIGMMIALGTAITVYVLPSLYRMAAATLVAFAPYLTIGAIVAGVALAFALLYDDVMAFLNGHDSMIGKLLNDYPILGQMIDGLKVIFNSIKEAGISAFTALIQVINFILDVVIGLRDAITWLFNTMVSVIEISLTSWGLLFDVLSRFLGDVTGATGIIDSAISAWGDIVASFGNMAGNVWDGLISKIRSFIDIAKQGINLIKSVAGSITGALGEVKSDLNINQSSIVKAKDTLATASSSPINTQTSNVTSNMNSKVSKSTNVQTGNITVNTQATDGESVARELGRTLNDQLRQTTASFDDGVAA